jgi:purine-nucleoside phosphorylase
MPMTQYAQRVHESSTFLKSYLEETPRVALLTGTGLGDSAKSLAVRTALEYRDIPHFPVSTVPSHPGKLLVGRIGIIPTIVLQGRFHLYEGYSPEEVTFPMRVLQELEIATLIVTNAAGGLNPTFIAGDLMVIADHINLTGENPLVGPNEDGWGTRFPDMGRAYDRELLNTAEEAANALGISLRKGVYVGLKGPSLETPSEVKFLKMIGADAVGFSTVQEVIAAVHAGMRVLGLSTITNVNNPDQPSPATLQEIIAVAQHAAPMLEKLIVRVVEKTFGA